MTKHRVVPVTRDPETKRSVASSLANSERFEAAESCLELEALATHLVTTPAGVVLVDIDHDPATQLEMLHHVSQACVQTRFVVLSSKIEDDLLLAAMQAGARNFVVKESISTTLEKVLHRVVPREDDRRSNAHTLATVLSVSGGCGATTIAVNLAYEIQLASADPALLVDLDGFYGAVASYLDLDGRYSVADVLSSTAPVDAEVVRSTAMPYSENLSVLISPASVDFAAPLPIDFSNLGDALSAFQEAYPHIVIDAPRVPMDVARTLVNQSTVTFIVFQLTVKDVRLAKSLSTALIESGVEANKLLGIANRFRKRHQMVTLNEAQEALGTVKVEPLRNDFRNSSLAINYGQPLAKIAPRSALRRDLEKQGRRLSCNGLQQKNGS